jgi:hypothetical protein
MGSYGKQVVQKQDNNDAYDELGKQSDTRVICWIRSDQIKKDK